VRIAVTGLRGIPGVMGGVETHCEELLPRVKASNPDFAITVFARAPYIERPRYEFRGISVVAVPSPRSVFLEAIFSTFAGIVAARRAKMDIIHIHAIGPALLSPVAKLLGLKVVVTHHGEDYNRAKWGAFSKAVLRLGERLGIKFADHVIAVAPSLGARLQRSFPNAKNRISYIPNGAPYLPDASGNTLGKFSLVAGGYILAVGRLVPEKGLHDLVEAHAESGDSRRLVIVGSTDHPSNYARNLIKKASDRVIFTGMLDRGSVRELFENASLFVMPSYHEGLPIAALEAGSCSAPMLLSDIRPNLDLDLPVHHYFPVGNTEALASGLRQSAAHYAVSEAEFRRKFDWNEIALQTAEVYRKILRN
jgi:glycosyltransferase involved in cell wall biosynthesis